MRITITCTKVIECDAASELALMGDKEVVLAMLDDRDGITRGALWTIERAPE